MSYLIAKFTLLFLLTGLLSFILGHWWSRRNFVDVSESFEALTRATSPDTSLWNRLWQRLDTIPAPKDTDFSEVYSRIDGVSKAVSAIPAPEPVSFQSVDQRLDLLTKLVEGIPAPAVPIAPDLAPVQDRLAKLEDAVKSIPAPEKPLMIDLAPLSGRIEKLESSVKAIPHPEKAAVVDINPVTTRIGKLEEAVRGLPRPEPARAVDLRPMETKLNSLSTKLESIPTVTTRPPTDLSPVTNRLSRLEQTVQSIPRPERTDLAPIDRRLNSIEVEVRALGKRITQPVKTQPPARKRATSPKPAAQQSGTRLLKSASHGTKDDLKKIFGVGPKLERLLNKNGVFYFWQVGSWTNKDIEAVDARLDGFNGRIARDKWVSQAKRLCRNATAAKPPSN